MSRLRHPDDIGAWHTDTRANLDSPGYPWFMPA
jgi:hypothetical protein